MDDSLRARQEAAAKNQALFREVNERIEQIGIAVEEQVDFVCECLDIDCSAYVPLATAQYESLRQSGGDRFVVIHGHEDPEVEVVVAEHERYLVVEKIEAGGDLAKALDRRPPA